MLAVIHEDSVKYYHQGHLYYKDTRAGVVGNIFRCNTRGRTSCYGRVYTDDELNIIDSVDHVLHSIDTNYLKEYEFRRKLYDCVKPLKMISLQFFTQLV